MAGISFSSSQPCECGRKMIGGLEELGYREGYDVGMEGLRVCLSY